MHEPAALHLGGGQQQHAAGQRAEHPAGDPRRTRLQPAQHGALAAVTLNPKGTSDTNLPTFVDVGLRPPVSGVLSVTADGDPYVWATAATPDGEAATVWAWVTGLTINPGTTNATPFN